MDVPSLRRSRALLVVLVTLLAVAALSIIAGAGEARADTGQWGGTGAVYTDGFVCTLPTATVPLASWSVNGSATAYALSDIVATGAAVGSAPTTGPAAPIGAGGGGINGTDVGAVAYLIQRHATSTVGVAETSAEIAAVAGGGSVQAQCLGQRGTSAASAAAALADARRYGGPYTVRVDAPENAIPGQRVNVGATVYSARGNPTPGIDVTFSVNGTVATATTGSDGRAQTPVPVATSSVPVSATISQPTSLTYFATNPPSVALSSAAGYSGTGVLRPAPAPQPTLTVSTTPLVLAQGTITPSVAVQGTNGYSGTGQLSVAGPVTPASGQTCNNLTPANYQNVPVAWTGNFTFTGDGAVQAGTTQALAPGCYGAAAAITVANSTPVVQASSNGVRSAATTQVSTMQVAGSSTEQVATPGRLATTVTATNPGSATVASTVVVRGPLAPKDGSCAGLDWSKAPTATTSAPATLRAGTTPATLSAKITAPTVSQLGCYALNASSDVAQDGRTATVQETIGQNGTTTLVTVPTLTVQTTSYGGTQGKSMTGTVAVLGSYKFPGVVSVGLRASTAVPTAGCAGVTFESVPERTTPTLVTTTGDGTYTFTTPIAPKNRCYAITATLQLTANPDVRADSPPPTAASVFLAGAVLRPNSINESRRAAPNDTVRTAIAFALALALLLALVLVVVIRAYRSARTNDELGGGWRPYRTEDDGPERRPSPKSLL